MCTLENHHNGPHVSHGWFNRVLAVWDDGLDRRQRRPTTTSAVTVSRQDFSDLGAVAVWKAVRRRLRLRPEYVMEEALFLIFFLAMVGFVADWVLRLLGLR